MDTQETTNQAIAGESQGSNQKSYGVLAVVIIAVLAVGVLYMQSSGSDQKATGAPTPTVAAGAAPDSALQQVAYEDGTYTVVGSYPRPNGTEEIGVELTLADNIITAVSVEVKAENPISKKMQEDFAANYKTQVVGKSLSAVKLEKVSGSSLTPKGFNDAIEKIKAQAQS